MNYDVLFENPLVVPTPGKKGNVITAPVSKLAHGFRKTEPTGKTVFVKTGNLLDFIVHPAEVYRTNINGKLFTDREIRVKSNSSDFYNFTAQMNRQVVEYF